MIIRPKVTLISTIILTLFLMAYIPGSLKFASTWRDLYFHARPFDNEQNLLLPLGLYGLGAAAIGLIVLWTGYIRNERWAWFVMLTILVVHIFPHLWLLALIEKIETLGPSRLLSVLASMHFWPTDLRALFDTSRDPNLLALGFRLDVLSFPVMLISLLMTIKAFFWKSANSNQG